MSIFLLKIKKITLFIKTIIIKKTKDDIRYRIIDISNNQTVIWIQCIQTNAIFYKKISETNIDLDIIGKLAPEQACFWGILFGKFLKNNELINIKSHISLFQSDFFLYAKESNNYCNSITFDRFGNIFFKHPETQLTCSHRVIDIISDAYLINSFHPTIACFIGLFFGHRNIVEQKNKESLKKQHLRLVSNS